jgi:hypothetical protein
MQDDFDGYGGSYIADPKTGKRKLVERTQETLAVVAEPPAPAVQETDEVE